MNSKHTPRPWAVSRDAVPEGHVQNTIYAEASGERVATAFLAEGNADLIAAAPDLLAALEECITDDGARCLNDDIRGERARRRLYAINDLARAAIARARGR